VLPVFGFAKHSTEKRLIHHVFWLKRIPNQKEDKQLIAGLKQPELKQVSRQFHLGLLASAAQEVVDLLDISRAAVF
jgi:hypothetical protein